MKNQNYYREIKENLIKNEVYKRVKDCSKNRNDLETYYKVGEILSKAGKHYGEGIIKEYSTKLTKELGKNYNERTLRRFRQFYYFINSIKWSAAGTVLTWSHYREIIALKDINEIKYYISKCEKLNLSTRQLRTLIKSKEYERLPQETKNKLINQKETNIKDLIPNPIIITHKNNIEITSEYLLHQLILENISDFMEQLGEGYSFIKSEYKIKIGNSYNYIDLLLFNIEFNCYIVVELKVTELRKEHIGQISIYMNYVDTHLKKITQAKTIGIIICKKDNKFILEYCSDSRILAREYMIV